MPQRSKVLQKRFLVILSAILVVAIPVGVFVLFPSGMFWTFVLEIGAMIQGFFTFLSAFFTWLTRY